MQKIRDSRISPYYDYSADELAAGYVSVLAIPGRPFQSREVNSISGLIYGQMKKISDILLSDGSIISGCNYIKDTTIKSDIKCILEPGSIYFNGLIIPLSIPDSGYVWSYNENESLSEVPHGSAMVCIEVTKYAITSADDKTLVDPAENYESFGVDGAYRLKYIAKPSILTETDFYKIAVNNKNVVSILRLFNGELIGPEKPKPLFSTIRSYIAERSYDSQGNYIAKGLQVKVKSSEDLENSQEKYVIYVSPGKVYMNGYDYLYNNRTIISSKAATDTLSTGNVPEVHEYVSGKDVYKLNYDYVYKVDNIVGEIETKGIPIRAKLNSDEIPDEYSPVASISRLYKRTGTGLSDIEVVSSDLYYLDSGRRIVWNTPISSTPSRPSLGSTYYIDIISSDSFSEGTDFIVQDNSIRFINANKKPRAARAFYVYYSWYIPRIDLLYIDENGNLELLNGIPANEQNLEEPTAPAGSLVLSAIYVAPGNSPENFKVENFHVMRMPVSELKSMRTRIDNLEYNLALTQLENSAQDKHTARESLATLENIFTESFDNMTKMDTGNFLCNCSVDVFSSQLKLPVLTDMISFRDITFLEGVDQWLPYHGILLNGVVGNISIDWQNYATDYLDLNPYGNIKQKAEIYLDPSYSVYSDDTYTYTANVFTPAALFYSQKKILNWWRKQNNTFFDTSDNDEEMAVNNQKVTGLRSLTPPYLKTETVTISGKNFPANADIEFYFDDIKIFVTPTSANYTLDADSEESTTGRVKANDDGIFKGTFALPYEVDSGTHTVTARTTDATISCMTPFTGKYELKALKMFEQTSKTDQTSPAAYSKVYNANYGEPIAQSVSFSSDIFISKIDLYFQAKNSKGFVFFAVREMDNGEPSSTVLYETLIPSSDIATNYESIDTPTTIIFDYPIYFIAGKEYCFTLGSDMAGYKLWCAKINGVDIKTRNTLQVKNHTGKFFQGAGNGKWTQVNDTTLTFALYRADFETSNTYYTDAITSNIGNFSMMNVSADYAKFDYTEVDLYYSININTTTMYSENNTNWIHIPFNEYIEIPQLSSYTTDGMELRFKIVMKTESSVISPIINMNSFEILLGKYDAKGNYISNTIVI